MGCDRLSNSYLGFAREQEVFWPGVPERGSSKADLPAWNRRARLIMMMVFGLSFGAKRDATPGMTCLGYT